MNKTDRHRLMQLLRLPTAPFREGAVIKVITKLLTDNRVPWFQDPVGNLVVGADSRPAYRRLLQTRATEPVRVFIAHMDHPGFHGTRWLSDRRLQVRWHGGSPTKRLVGASVWLAVAQNYLARGRVVSVRLDPAGHGIHTADIVIQSSSWISRPRASLLFGGFRFRAPVWQSGQHLYTQAADDLVGVFAVLQTAIALWNEKRRAPFLGLLTRAEEVGFVGAVGHLELGWLNDARRPIVCVSLETSRALPGAYIGKGPVVRLGDRRTVFEPGALQVLTETAQRLLPGRHQRRLMDGGACEATAATAWGHPAIGISVPLGNYHNQHGVSGAPAPEFVHLKDVEGMLALCRALMATGLAWSTPWKQQRRRLSKNLETYRRLL